MTCEVLILLSLLWLPGFIMMCPQLFINYKLKSVSHLPWRQMTYKFLNTIIDDLFAFVIKMPMLHRLSVFRDGGLMFHLTILIIIYYDSLSATPWLRIWWSLVRAVDYCSFFLRLFPFGRCRCHFLDISVPEMDIPSGQEACQWVWIWRGRREPECCCHHLRSNLSCRPEGWANFRRWQEDQLRAFCCLDIAVKQL